MPADTPVSQTTAQPRCPICGRFMRRRIWTAPDGAKVDEGWRCIKVQPDDYMGGALEHG